MNSKTGVAEPTDNHSTFERHLSMVRSWAFEV